MSIELVMPSNHLILCHPLLLLSSILPIIRRVFSNESSLCIRWPKYWVFSISPPNVYSGLISFKIDWFDLAVQVSLNSFLHHHSLVVLCFLYSPALTSVHNSWKDIASTIWTFVSKVMSLFLNTLSRLVLAFLPRSHHLLILWLLSPSTVISESKKRKSVTASTFSLFAMKWWDWMPWSWFFNTEF